MQYAQDCNVTVTLNCVLSIFYQTRNKVRRNTFKGTTLCSRNYRTLNKILCKLSPLQGLAFLENNHREK